MTKRWVSVLDHETCEQCLNLHGRLSTNLFVKPPLHEDCRCVMVACDEPVYEGHQNDFHSSGTALSD